MNSPTSARPGTEEKIRVLQERVAQGLPLFHPDDAPMECDDTVRVPVISKRHHQLVTWQTMDEREHRENCKKNPAKLHDWYGLLTHISQNAPTISLRE